MTGGGEFPSLISIFCGMKFCSSLFHCLAADHSTICYSAGANKVLLDNMIEICEFSICFASSRAPHDGVADG